jgi:hypothetical protein
VTITETRTDRPSVRVVRAVAAAKGVDFDDLEPLSEVVDLEAIDDLFTNSSADLRVEWTLDGFVVAVDADGEVSVSAVPTS